MVQETPSWLLEQGQYGEEPAPSLRRVTVTHLGAAQERGRQSASPTKPLSQRYLGCCIDGRYWVERVVGEGGMGVVYECRRSVIDKRVAMKVLRADLARDSDSLGRFVTEAKAASAIGSPHIVDVIDFGLLPDACAYFIMEYLDGDMLSSRLSRHGYIPTATAVRYAMQIAEALGAAHEAGIVHRDLKPDNVFIVRHKKDDFIKIVDFGIAKVQSMRTRITRVGDVLGTPHYMSPEQAKGLEVDHRTDIYSLGIMLYEMVTGHVPFDGDQALSILSQQASVAPIAPHKRDDLPQPIDESLEMVILHCLMKRAEDRYATMESLLDDLERCERGQPLSLESSRISGELQPSRDRTSSPNPVEGSPSAAPSSNGSSSPSSATAHGPGSTRWYPMYVGGLLGLLGLASMVVTLTRNTWQQPPTDAAMQTEAPAPIPKRGSPSPTSASSSMLVRPPASAAASVSVVEEPDTFPVTILLAPVDAELHRGKENLGTMPLTVSVREGEEVELTARHPRYWPRRFTIDDSKSKVVVRLAPILRRQPVAAQQGADAGTGSSLETEARPGGDGSPAAQSAP